MTLLQAKPEAVKKLIDTYEKQTEEIKSGALTMAWYMRGGASYEDVLNMSNSERKTLNNLIEQNLETTKKTQLPFF